MMSAVDLEAVERRHAAVTDPNGKSGSWLGEASACIGDVPGLVAEVRRLREALGAVNANMDHTEDCDMAAPGPAACTCPMAFVREALGLAPEVRS